MGHISLSLFYRQVKVVECANVCPLSQSLPYAFKTKSSGKIFLFHNYFLTLPITCIGSYPVNSLPSSISAGIATSYWADDRGFGVKSPDGVKNFHFSMSFRPALGSTQPPIQWVLGILSPWAKRPSRDAKHSPPTSVEVKKTWVYTSTPLYTFMV
jgi:hypothetical protein